MSWESSISHHSDIERERLEHAAEVMKDRIEKAAVDPTNNPVQDGIDIGALWFAVLRRREQLTKSNDPEAREAAEDATEAQEKAATFEVENDADITQVRRFHVVFKNKGWTWEREGEEEPQGEFRTQGEAEDAAKQTAREEGGAEVIIHRRDGRVRDSDTIGNAPEGPKRDTVR